MKSRSDSPQVVPRITIRVSVQLFEAHLSYLDQLVKSAGDCRLWPELNLQHLEELDRVALLYLIDGEDRDFGIVACPTVIRERMDNQRGPAAA